MMVYGFGGKFIASAWNRWYLHERNRCFCSLSVRVLCSVSLPWPFSCFLQVGLWCCSLQDIGWSCGLLECVISSGILHCITTMIPGLPFRYPSFSRLSLSDIPIVPQRRYHFIACFLSGWCTKPLWFGCKWSFGSFAQFKSSIIW